MFEIINKNNSIILHYLKFVYLEYLLYKAHVCRMIASVLVFLQCWGINEGMLGNLSVTELHLQLPRAYDLSKGRVMITLVIFE